MCKCNKNLEVGLKIVAENYNKEWLPRYATDGSGCFDVSTTSYERITRHDPKILNTGLAFEIPEDHVMLVFSRSGHGFKDNIRLANCVGVIDSDYTGELKIKLTADGWQERYVIPGERVAQAMVIPVKQVEFVFKDELKTTERGDGGFGSTGA